MSKVRVAGGRHDEGDMLTPFGKMVRGLRREKGILLIDMAKMANVTSGFLSLVETGKKQIPDRLVTAIVAGLDLNEQDARELHIAADLSAKEFKIQVSAGAPTLDRKVAHALQTGFAKMSPTAKAKILKLLEQG